MYNTPRAATVKCTEAGSLWQLSRSDYRATLLAGSAASEASLFDFLKQVPLFTGLTPEQIARVSELCETVTFETPQRVVEQGDIAEHIYIVIKGAAYAQKRGTQERFVIKPQGCFGESALAMNAGEEARMRKADVFAEAGCAMARLAVADFHDTLGHSLDTLAAKNLNMKLMQTVKIADTPIVSMLPKADLEKFIAALEDVTYDSGDHVIEEGEHGDAFFIIKSGEAVVSTKSKGDVANLGEGPPTAPSATVRPPECHCPPSRQMPTPTCHPSAQATFSARWPC